WIIWRNVDQLPGDPAQEMSPTVLATLALRLHKLGYLSGSLPASYDGRLREAVQRFQRDMALSEDGIVGPRTTLALSRVIGGRFNPTLGEPGRR
ncbi:MAG TPA: peptidoglycan-binding domain-containing protein, partial [Methylomirabilota bacterium]|nr:peptidoglycan-binding domain-containing protein [Methylomirabilota bacterium]